MNWETFAIGVVFSLAGSALGWGLGGLLRGLLGKPPLTFRQQARAILPGAVVVALVVGFVFGVFL